MAGAMLGDRPEPVESFARASDLQEMQAVKQFLRALVGREIAIRL